MQENNELKTLCENYSTVVYQMGHATEDMTELSQRTVVEPMKKLNLEFPSIQVSELSTLVYAVDFQEKNKIRFQIFQCLYILHR